MVWQPDAGEPNHNKISRGGEINEYLKISSHTRKVNKHYTNNYVTVFVLSGTSIKEKYGQL